jgi:hypothetical protein
VEQRQGEDSAQHREWKQAINHSTTLGELASVNGDGPCSKDPSSCNDKDEKEEGPAVSFRTLPKPNEFQALSFLQCAWRQVSPSTIKNCWQHTRIIPVSWLDSSLNQNQHSDDLEETTATLNELAAQAGLPREELGTAADWIGVDQHLPRGAAPLTEPPDWEARIQALNASERDLVAIPESFEALPLETEGALTDYIDNISQFKDQAGPLLAKMWRISHRLGLRHVDNSLQDVMVNVERVG